ncbi:MAG TPA: hypothetical protein VF094_04465 [Gaiellaceae bacterium]
MSAAARYLLLAQVAFWTAMLFCVAIAHGGLGDNHGFSFFGGRLSTILPYAVGFVVAAALIAHAAKLLERSGREREATGLRILVVLLLADLLTPDTLGSVFYDAHIAASIVLFLFEAAFGLWLVLAVSAAAASQLYATQVGGGLLAAASQLHWAALLSLGIFVFQVAFGALLVTAVASLPDR